VALPPALEAEALALEISALAEEATLEASEEAEAAAPESCSLSAELFKWKKRSKNLQKKQPR
jgi:hypothetical protein